MNYIHVKAKNGVLVPKEDNPKRYIDSEKTVAVPKTAYYLRRIKEGDLVPMDKNAPALESA